MNNNTASKVMEQPATQVQIQTRMKYKYEYSLQSDGAFKSHSLLKKKCKLI